jgi:hypothetical protein
MNTTFGATSTTDQVLAGVDLSGQRVLVTGVSAGLGVETARVLAAHGAEVIGAARDLAKAHTATEPVRAQAAHGGSLHLIQHSPRSRHVGMGRLRGGRRCRGRPLLRGLSRGRHQLDTGPSRRRATLRPRSEARAGAMAEERGAGRRTIQLELNNCRFFRTGGIHMLTSTTNQARHDSQAADVLIPLIRAAATIGFAVAPCSMGFVIIAVSEQLIRSIMVGDDPEMLMSELQNAFPNDALAITDRDQELVAQVVDAIDGAEPVALQPQELRAAKFQQRVRAA